MVNNFNLSANSVFVSADFGVIIQVEMLLLNCLSALKIWVIMGNSLKSKSFISKLRII